ncbi:MAG: hypothetical protein ACFFC3_10100, partial [Candidatus Odinarchaeota archaeon]
MFSRLSKIQRSLINSLERNFWEAQPKLKLYASKLNIPIYITETAWRIYCEVAKQKLTMGRSIEGFIAASLYAAIRIHEFPKLLDDVADVSMVPDRTLFRSLGMIVRQILPILNLEYHPISADKLVFLFGNKLRLPEEIKIKALYLLQESSKKGLPVIGKDPKGLAAAVLYMVAKNTNFKKKQVEITQVAKITEVTLRSRIKDIKGNYALRNDVISFTSMQIQTDESTLNANGTVDIAQDMLNLNVMLATNAVSDLSLPYYSGVVGSGDLSGTVTGSFDNP